MNSDSINDLKLLHFKLHLSLLSGGVSQWACETLYNYAIHCDHLFQAQLFITPV